MEGRQIQVATLAANEVIDEARPKAFRGLVSKMDLKKHKTVLVGTSLIKIWGALVKMD